MQYNIYINGKFKDRIDPVLLETIEAAFNAEITEVKKVVGGTLYDYRDIFLTTKKSK